MTVAAGLPATAHRGLSGWLEAGLFAVALSVLNVAYALGHQMGAHPVAFLVYTMLIAAGTLLTCTGAGPHWRQIVRHPLSIVVGGGIIAMETVYYMLLRFVPPADGSLLVRLNVPVAAVLGLLLVGRRPARLGLAGHSVVLAAIACYVATMEGDSRWIGVALGLGCALIMSGRSFATEFHPWNRRARTVEEKMRLTGLVLLEASLLGAGAIGGLMAMAGAGHMAQPAWLPEVHHFLHAPTIALSLFMGALVLTVMQYLMFSVVLKIRAENFVATTALIPLVTAAFQAAAVALGILAPIPLAWAVVVPMLAVFAGVVLVIWSGRQDTA